MAEYYIVVDLDHEYDGVPFVTFDNKFRGPRAAAAYHDWFYKAQKRSAIRRKRDQPMGWCACTVALCVDEARLT